MDPRHARTGTRRRAAYRARCFYDEMLPRVVAELDPRTPYWPGSPVRRHRPQQRARRATSTTGRSGTATTRVASARRRGAGSTPERVAFTRYAEDMGRFISEFGMLAAPDRETLRRWIPADQLRHHSPALDHHTKDNPKDKVDIAARDGHRPGRRPGRVRRLLDDRPGRGAEVRRRALPPAQAALLGHPRLAAQRLLAGAELVAGRLPRLPQGGVVGAAARLRAGAGLLPRRRRRDRAVGHQRHARRRRGRGARAPGDLRGARP